MCPCFHCRLAALTLDEQEGPQLSPVSPALFLNDSDGRFEETVASILGYGVLGY